MNWYYQEDGVQVGPLTDDEFDQRVKGGRVQAETLVWNESLTGWQPYRSIGMGAGMPQTLQRCTNCNREFPEQDMIRYQNSWVCASCKPLFFQRLKEGGLLPGMLEYAGFWPRAGAKIIDQVIVSAVNMIFMFIFIFSSMGFGFFTDNTADASPIQIIMILIGYALIFVFSVAYSVWFLAKYGATPGKMALGLKVITPEGGPISMARAFGRFFAEVLSGMICYVGYIMAAFDKEERKALHDILCNTRVVRK